MLFAGDKIDTMREWSSSMCTYHDIVAAKFSKWYFRWHSICAGLGMAIIGRCWWWWRRLLMVMVVERLRAKNCQHFIDGVGWRWCRDGRYVSRVIVQQRFYTERIRSNADLWGCITIATALATIGAVAPCHWTIFGLIVIVIALLANHINLNIIIVQIRFAVDSMLCQIFRFQCFDVNCNTLGAQFTRLTL